MRISDWSSDVCSSDLAAQLVKYAGGRRQAAVGDLGALLGERLGVPGVSMAAVEEGGNLADLVEQLVGPVTEHDVLATTLQLESRTPAFLDHTEEVVEIGRASCRERLCQ